MTDNLTKRDQPDRSKINMKQDYEVHYWTKHLNISKEELQKVVDRRPGYSLWCGNEVSGCQCSGRQNARPSGETTEQWERPSIRKFCLPSNRCGQPVGEFSHISWRP